MIGVAMIGSITSMRRHLLGDVFFHEKIDTADADEGGRKPGQIRDAGGHRAFRHLRSTGGHAEQRGPATAVRVPRPH